MIITCNVLLKCAQKTNLCKTILKFKPRNTIIRVHSTPDGTNIAAQTDKNNHVTITVYFTEILLKSTKTIMLR